MFADSPQVTVDRLCGMKEMGRCSGRGESCRQLLTDESRLSHSRNDDIPRALEDEAERITEGWAERVGLGGDRGAFFPKNFSGEI